METGIEITLELPARKIEFTHNTFFQTKGELPATTSSTITDGSDDELEVKTPSNPTFTLKKQEEQSDELDIKEDSSDDEFTAKPS